MIVTTKIKTDFILQGPHEVVRAMQDDKYSRNVEISMFAGGVPFAPEAGGSVRVRYMKPDGKGGNYDALPDGTPAWGLQGSVLTIALAPQVLTTPGRVNLCVALIQKDVELHTFSIHVEVSPNPGVQYSSKDYYKLSGMLAASGWTPNMYLGTDANGNVIVSSAPDGKGVLADSGWTPNAIMGTDDQGRVCIIEADATLTKRGMPADAEAVGLAIGQIGDALDAINGRIV